MDAIALLAFERATRERAPIAPSIELAVELAVWLQDRGFLTLCADDDRTAPKLPQRAIYHPIAWRYRTFEHGPALEAVLLQHTRRLAADRDSEPLKAALWRELARSELEGYLGAQLRRHGLDSQWAVDVRELSATWIQSLPLSRLRYVVWAAVREGAAEFLRTGGDPEETRDAIHREMRRRALWLETRHDLGVGFLPMPGARQSLVLSIFLDEVAWLGADYWSQVPSATAIRAHEAQRAE